MFVNFKRATMLIAFLLACSISSIAQQSVTMVAPAEPLADALAGIKATSEIRRFNRDNLAEMVADRAPIYGEYRVVSASHRIYGAARVELFQTNDQFAAYGLLTYFAAARDPKAKPPAIGMEAVQLADAIIFYKGNYFARVANADQKSKAIAAIHLRLAQSLAESLPEGNQAAPRPPLFDSLAPALDAAKTAGYEPDALSQRYFLGPQSMSAFVDRARDMFVFPGEAEAVMVECSALQREKIKLIIVEYHTPQFATDAMQQLDTYLESLTESERARLSVRREGNYIIEAVADNADLAAQMISSIKYPYSVKWLRNPLWPTNDPFRAQKAARMLLSTFGILGAILGTVLLFGSVFGATVFLRRRKLQREAFSDAGGMLRLDLDPMESVMLGLPPARGEE
ncbi:MAG: DUF6599 family protein [Acidobacteriota bacterium]